MSKNTVKTEKTRDAKAALRGALARLNGEARAEKRVAKRAAEAVREVEKARKAEVHEAREGTAMEVIREMLAETTAAKPTTKAKILKVLAKRFPERDATALARTLNGRLSWQFPREGMPLRHENGNWWVEAKKAKKAKKAVKE